MPILSIITINYNNVKGLQKTIDSVIGQTFNDYEYIIIDGGSSDGSVELIKKYGNKINYWVSEKDNGVFDAQNKGLQKAQGEYTQVLNSGDELASRTILEDIFLNKTYNADILYGNMYIQGESNIPEKGYMPSEITKGHMVKDTLWHPVSFVKRSFLKKVGSYELQYKITADYDWFLRALFIHKASTYYLNKFIAVFYEDGLSSNEENTKQIIYERRKAQKAVFGPGLFLIKVCNYWEESVTRLLKKVFRIIFLDKNLPYPHLYSSGIPRDKIENTTEKIKLVIDPSSKYFSVKRIIDHYLYDKVVLIHACEPPEIKDTKKEVMRYGNGFTKVYSFDTEVVEAIQGSELFCFGSCWISDESNYSRFTKEKKYKLSFIKSAKDVLEGHKFRTKVGQLLQKNYPFEVLFPKERIESKEILFTDSMFHIAIENSRHDNYFTEKIVDCFMSYTVPIYWGCPNIASYFDARGIIVVNSQEELEKVLNQLTKEDYTSRSEAIEKNFLIAKENYAFFFQRINRIVKNS